MSEPDEFFASITLIGDGDIRVAGPKTVSPSNHYLLKAWMEGLLTMLESGTPSAEAITELKECE